MFDGLYLNRDGVAVFNEAAAPSTDELGCAPQNHQAHHAVIDAPGGSHRRIRGELLRRNGQRWGAEVSASRLVHLSDCARSTSWAKVLSLQSLPSQARPSTPELRVNLHGFSLHAGVRWRGDQRKELELLCRYITRPTIANERLKRNRAGQVVLQLKSPYKDGTTHIVMEPLEFMERLAALVPRPRLHLIRFHGVLAPNAKLRSKIVPAPARRATESSSEDADAQGAPARMS